MASGNDCREVHRHTPYYCEENVYWLARSFLSEQAREGTEDASYFAVVVSNPKKAVPMWQQKAGEEAMCGLVVWDYHVFLLECSRGGPHATADGVGAAAGQPKGKATRVYDLDTRLSFPCDAKDYFQQSFAFNEEKLRHQGFDLTYFKLIEAETYVAEFSSDRAHMLSAEGTWLAKPPDYPPILTDDGKSIFHKIYVTGEEVASGVSGWGHNYVQKDFELAFL